MVIHFRQADWSVRKLARQLGISRNTIRNILQKHRLASWEEATDALEPPTPRHSILDPFKQRIGALLSQYPDARPTRVFEVIQGEGFAGGFTIVKDFLRRIAPKPVVRPVERFETDPGQQAQQDWSPYTLPWGQEHAFSYILGYSRRQHVEFTDREDFFTMIRCHVRAFQHLGGVARVCLYDNQKVVVIRWEAGLPIYNTRFLAFATHYGFRPKALKPRSPELKGKVERPFQFLETSFFNTRSFTDRADLQRQLAEWLANRNDLRTHRTTKEPPLARHAEEVGHLLPLPRHPYDTAQVVYRIATVEALIHWDGNFYSVPPPYITQPLAVKIGEKTLTVYSPDIQLLTEHELYPTGAGEVRRKPEHRISHAADRGRRELEMLLPAFEQLGPAAAEFVTGLKRAQPRTLAHHLAKILELKRRYNPDDITVALEHALRYHAYDFRAIERILTARAQERSIEEPLSLLFREKLRAWCRENPASPRPLESYQQLLESSGRVPLTGPLNTPEVSDDSQGDDPGQPEETEAGPYRPDPRRPDR
mgnify:CR=1 FL=1